MHGYLCYSRAFPTGCTLDHTYSVIGAYSALLFYVTVDSLAGIVWVLVQPWWLFREQQTLLNADQMKTSHWEWVSPFAGHVDTSQSTGTRTIWAFMLWGLWWRSPEEWEVICVETNIFSPSTFFHSFSSSCLSLFASCSSFLMPPWLCTDVCASICMIPIFHCLPIHSQRQNGGLSQVISPLLPVSDLLCDAPPTRYWYLRQATGLQYTSIPSWLPPPPKHRCPPPPSPLKEHVQWVGSTEWGWVRLAAN